MRRIAIFASLHRPLAAVSTAVVLLGAHTLGARAQATSGLREADTLYTSALTSGDVATAASFFDENGVLLPRGNGRSDGRSSVASYLAGFMTSGQRITLTPADLRQVDPSTAREIGTYQLTASQPDGAAVQGRYATLWVLRAGDWKIAEQDWTS